MISPVSSHTLTQTAPPTIKLVGDERWLFCGKTGSGKSFLARELLKAMAGRGWRLALIDIEGMWMGKRPQWEKREPGTVDKPRLVTQYEPKANVQLYMPTTPGWLDEGLEQFLAGCFNAGDMVVYFDELVGVVSATRYGPMFGRVWTQGRKHNLAAWCATQRPRRIPEIVVSQAENYAVFRITNEDDRKLLASAMSSPAVAEAPVPSRFWWYVHQETMDRAALMQPIASKNASAAHAAGGRGNAAG